MHTSHSTPFLSLGAALLALAASASASAQKLTLLPDPLDLSGALPHDYRNWAAVLAQVMLASEGTSPSGDDSSPAVAALGRVLLAAHGRLASLAAGGGDPAALFPRFHLRLDEKVAQAFGHHEEPDPKWAAHFGMDGVHPVPAGCPGGDVPGEGGHSHNHTAGGMGGGGGGHDGHDAGGAKSAARTPAGRRGLRAEEEGGHAHEEHAAEGSGMDDGHDHGGHNHMECQSMTGHTMVHKLWVSKAFLNYQPCVLQEAAHGVHAGLTGLRFAPRLLDLMPSGLMAGIQGLNLNPSLIYFAPMGLNVQ